MAVFNWQLEQLFVKRYRIMLKENKVFFFFLSHLLKKLILICMKSV